MLYFGRTPACPEDDSHPEQLTPHDAPYRPAQVPVEFEERPLLGELQKRGQGKENEHDQTVDPDRGGGRVFPVHRHKSLHRRGESREQGETAQCREEQVGGDPDLLDGLKHAPEGGNGAFQLPAGKGRKQGGFAHGNTFLLFSSAGGSRTRKSS